MARGEIDVDAAKSNLLKGLITFFVIAVIALNCFYTVSAGERAVLITLGNPSMTPYSEGLHFKIPFIQSVVIMDVKTLKYQAELTAASKDLQDVKTTIAINYRLDPSRAPEIYKTIGVNYQDTVIYPMEQETNKATTAQFTAEELITKREQVRQSMRDLLEQKLSGRGIIIEEISIVNFQFSESFTQAIEAKVTAEQKALQAKNVLVQVEYEAQQRVAEATGKADAMRIENQALAQNQKILQLRAIEKWDGKLPAVTGGAIPFIDAGGLLSPQTIN